MKRFSLSIAPGVLLLTAACGSHAAVPDGATVLAATRPGTVVIPANSPMLRQIARQAVVTADLPTDEVVAPGKIEANPNRVSKVMLPVAGRVSSVLVKVGDAVTRDQPLLTLVSPDADAATSALISADAALAQAQAAFGKAQADFDRASDLFEHNAVARKDAQAAESARAQAEGAVQQAHASREQAARRLALLGLKPGDFKQDVVLRAPLAGKVLDLTVVPGEFRNDTNACVMTIADLSTVWVTSQVPESYIRFVQVGERVEVSLAAYPGEVFDGRVVAARRRCRSADPYRSRSTRSWLNPRGRFRPEMFGSIHHIESFDERYPVIPAGRGCAQRRRRDRSSSSSARPAVSKKQTVEARQTGRHLHAAS